MVIIPELKPKRQSVFGKRTLVTYLPLPIWLFISSFFVSCCIVHNCYSVFKQGSVVCSRVVFLYRTSSKQPVFSVQSAGLHCPVFSAVPVSRPALQGMESGSFLCRKVLRCRLLRKFRQQTYGAPQSQGTQARKLYGRGGPHTHSPLFRSPY